VLLFKQIKLRNILSFTDTTVELRGLNVLIGPNGVGKSNLIEVMGLLHAAPTDLPSPILQLGGIREVLSLASRRSSPVARVECEGIGPRKSLRYSLEFSEDQGFSIQDEKLDASAADANTENYRVLDGRVTYFERRSESMVLGAFRHDAPGLERRQIPRNQSVLAAYRIPGDKTPITEVGRSFEQIRIYREFRTSGPYATARTGVSSSATRDFLHDGGDNLAVVLQDLDFKGVHARIQSYVREFCDRFEDVKFRLNGPIAQTYIQESGLAEPLSAVRLSDGTLKFLCLLAVLLNPDIPPLICIEEPEVGLHPDAIKIVAEALVDASERTQLIVTTHSEALIDALSHRPEDVLVCERDFDNGTQFRRLDRDQLSTWLERYTLSALWRKGELGGTRW
jgi:predicted ATPase